MINNTISNNKVFKGDLLHYLSYIYILRRGMVKYDLNGYSNQLNLSMILRSTRLHFKSRGNSENIVLFSAQQYS